MPAELQLPRELSKVSLPIYRIEPPDTIQIEILRLVPRAPYHIESHDALQISAVGVPDDEPLNAYYLVDEEGLVDLGPAYGTVWIVGMTIEQAKVTITQHLQSMLPSPQVSVQLARSSSAENLTGTYVVQPDGTVNLRGFGEVRVAGMNVTEARVAVEQHLGHYFESLSVGLNVSGFNSKVYYIVVAGVRTGESVVRVPITGNETVLDAIGQVGGLSQVSSKTMWVSRPSPGCLNAEQTFPIDWNAIARGGSTETNYQLLPGDRLYIVDDSLVATNDTLAALTAPLDRLLSITSLGTSTVRSAEVMGRVYNKNRQY